MPISERGKKKKERCNFPFSWEGKSKIPIRLLFIFSSNEGGKKPNLFTGREAYLEKEKRTETR